MQRIGRIALHVLIALGILGLSSCAGPRISGTKTYCGRISERLALQVGGFAQGTRMPASTGVEVAPEWAVARLNETQAWMDELEGARDSARVRAVLSELAIHWVSLFAHLDGGSHAKGRETLRQIAKIHGDAREILCQP